MSDSESKKLKTRIDDLVASYSKNDDVSLDQLDRLFDDIEKLENQTTEHLMTDCHNSHNSHSSGGWC
jgi:hypothetical protein